MSPEIVTHAIRVVGACGAEMALVFGYALVDEYRARRRQQPPMSDPDQGSVIHQQDAGHGTTPPY